MVNEQNEKQTQKPSIKQQKLEANVDENVETFGWRTWDTSEMPCTRINAQLMGAHGTKANELEERPT